MPLPDLREASRGEEQHDLRCHEDLGTPLDAESHLPGRAAGVYRDSGHGTLSPPPATLQPLFTFAYQDPVLIQDSRVFRNMLEIEEFYLAASNYFQMGQQEESIPAGGSSNDVHSFQVGRPLPHHRH